MAILTAFRWAFNIRRNILTQLCVIVMVSHLYAQDDIDESLVRERVSSVVSSLQKSLSKELSETEKRDTLTQLATLSELAGDIVSAQDFYQQASFAVTNSKDFQSLLASALLLNELGEYRDAEAQARGIIATCRDQDLVEKAQQLLVRVYLHQGKEQEAAALYAELLQSGSDDVGLLMLPVTDLAQTPDQNGERTAKISDSYADSPSVAIIRGEVGVLPSPNRLSMMGDWQHQPLIADKAPEEVEMPTTDNKEENREQSSVIAIQTGSFTNADNAEKMKAALSELEYAVEIVRYKTESATYYRVVVKDVDIGEMQSVLLGLKDDGYEGFPIYD